MPISSFKNFLVVRKTTPSAKASPVARPQQTNVRVIQTPKIRYSSLKARGNNKSIFSRIASSFKTMSFKAIKERAQIKIIRKAVNNNMPGLKARLPYELQNLHKKMSPGTQEISDSYIRGFSSLKKTFTDEEGMTAPSESIITMADKNKDGNASAYVQHLIGFCGGDKNQASTLSTLLTPETLKLVNQQLKKSSPILRSRLTTGLWEVGMHVHMMEDKTTRVVITQRFDAINKPNLPYATIVKTTIDVPPQASSSGINPIILRDVNFTEAQ